MWKLSDLRLWIDNCHVAATLSEASRTRRWEYFATSEGNTAGGFVNVALGANGALLDLTHDRGVQHMLMSCISDENKGLAASGGGATSYQTAVMAMTDVTSTGLK